MYRILISAMAYDSGKSGISDYIDNVTRELARDNSVDVIVLKQDSGFFNDIGDNINLIKYPNILSMPIINILWHLFVLPFCVNFNKYDFIFLPAGNRRLLCKYPIFTIATVHDLSQFHISGKYSRLRMLYISRVVPFFLKNVNRICAISESTKRDILEYFHIPECKVFVNYNGCNMLKFESSGHDSQEVKKRFGLEKDFILYVSRIEHPGKNHLNLVRAYLMLPEDVRSKIELVFAGSDWSGADIVKEYVRNAGAGNDVRFLGFVTNEELAGLYRSARLYAFPSFYEGFGIPLLEAMAVGVPVVCSNTSSLPEIGAEAVITFDPNSPEDIRRQILKVLANSELAQNMVERGYERIKKFSWHKHAKGIVKQYEACNK